MEEVRNAFRILRGKRRGKRLLGRSGVDRKAALEVDGRTILEWILEK